MTDADAERRPRSRPSAPRPTSTRDRDELHAAAGDVAGDQACDDPEVSELVVPESNGMSSETLLFECTWREPDG